jgi:hypothetical protein
MWAMVNMVACLEVIPNYNCLRVMLKELFTELVLNMKTGLVINNESINDME